MHELRDMSVERLIERLNEACRMVVEERAHALRLADVWERKDAEITQLRRRINSLEAEIRVLKTGEVPF